MTKPETAQELLKREKRYSIRVVAGEETLAAVKKMNLDLEKCRE